jgi:hypothetical protein
MFVIFATFAISFWLTGTLIILHTKYKAPAAIPLGSLPVEQALDVNALITFIVGDSTFGSIPNAVIYRGTNEIGSGGGAFKFNSLINDL